MKVLVTGCSGRFGSYVVGELEAAGHDIALFDLKKPEGAMEKWPWVEGGITRYEDCERAAGTGVEAVVHLAAQPWPTDHPRQQERRKQAGLAVNHTINVNLVGTYNVLHACMLAGVKTFVMTGTNCVFGQAGRITADDYPCEKLPLDEGHPSDLQDSYAFTKLVNEQMLELYSRVYGMRTYVIRCAGLFDEEIRRKIAETTGPVKKWDWGMWGWVAREDAAAAHRLVLDSAEGLPPHDVFLCNADDTSVREPSRELVEKFRPDLLPRIVGPLEGRASFFNNQKLKRAVGWEPKIRFDSYL